MKKLLLVFLCSLPLMTHAQDLQLTRNGKTKTIKAGTFIEVDLPTASLEPCNTCPIYTMAGQLISSEDNKVRLKIKTSTQPIVNDRIAIGSQTKTFTSGDNAPVMEIPKDIILSITKKGKKKVREHSTPEVIGMTILILGLSHVASSPFVEITEGNDSGFLLALGATEFVAGLVLGMATRQKALITHPDHPANPEKQKIWKLN